MSLDRPSVAVVGAGLAGLACADRLASSTDVVLLEAQGRVGGRCWSSSGWADGQIAEHGGELIETGQDRVLALVAELGLELESRQPDRPAVGYAHLGGRPLDLDGVRGFTGVTNLLEDDLRKVSGVTADTAYELLLASGSPVSAVDVAGASTCFHMAPLR